MSDEADGYVARSTRKQTKYGVFTQVRTFDRDGFRRRAGCVCLNDDLTQVLLISSSTLGEKKENWVLPAGGVDPGELVRATAPRETMEEAGASGRLGRSLGLFQNDRKRTKTEYFLLFTGKLHDTWEEGIQGRRRAWFPVKDAVERLSHKPLQARAVLAAAELVGKEAEKDDLVLRDWEDDSGLYHHWGTRCLPDGKRLDKEESETTDEVEKVESLRR